MIIDRVILIKYFICYELFFIICIYLLLYYSNNVILLIIIFILIWNSVFELILALNAVFSNALIIEPFFLTYSLFLLH